MEKEEKILYLPPKVKAIELQPQAVICQSMNGDGNEGYGNGNTDGWY